MMVAGSDTGGQWDIAGFSLHQDFDLLAAGRISPLKVLQMTTLNAAKFLGREGVMGSVAAGKDADLVLLDGNPISSVSNLHRIAGVVRFGKFYSRADLDALLEEVASRADGTHP
jgi:imidazolonepropionase-like amidohydrolase